jgi:V8-like Glu-specific endopeptidase
VLLTAGHCIYSHHKPWGIGYFAQKSFEFYERVSKDQVAERLHVKPLKAITTRGWIEDQVRRLDWTCGWVGGALWRGVWECCAGWI